jgi:hypothetical protein
LLGPFYLQMLELNEIVHDLAIALKAVDATGPVGRSKTRTYQPGVGPLTEAAALQAAYSYLTQTNPDRYRTCAPRELCDMTLEDDWALEAILIRPFGDNGKPAEHWSENVLHPYPGNISSIGDCLKLVASKLCKRKAAIVFGYEHTPAIVSLEPAVQSFELIARNVLGIALGARQHAFTSGLIHPVHQQLHVSGWEVHST